MKNLETPEDAGKGWGAVMATTWLLKSTRPEKMECVSGRPVFLNEYQSLRRRRRRGCWHPAAVGVVKVLLQYLESNLRPVTNINPTRWHSSLLSHYSPLPWLIVCRICSINRNIAFSTECAWYSTTRLQWLLPICLNSWSPERRVTGWVVEGDECIHREISVGRRV